MDYQAGISKFEFLVVLTVIGIVSWVGLAQLRQVQEMGEKTVVEATVRNIQSGLQHEMGHHLAQGTEASIADIVGSNPVRWLERPPAGYLGEFDSAPPAMVPGQWFYDRARRELVYWPRLSRNLKVEAADGRLRWRVEPSGGPRQTVQVTRVRVSAAVAYRWYEGN